MADRILIKGGHVVTVDPELDDIAGGDVLIEGDTIAQVGTDLSADAEIIDATGCIVIPGFVDSHRHTWETAIRNCAPDATLDDYFVEVLDSFAPLYRPEDVYASNLAGALECDGTAPGVAPVIDPVGAVVLSADTSNVDTVIVGGTIHKRGGRLVADWDRARAAVQASSDHLREALERKNAAAEAQA